LIEFEGIEINNVASYKSAKLPLNKHKLLVIQGKNLDRRSNKETASNASGKSVLFNSMSNVLFNSLRSSVKKNDSKSLINEDNSSVALTLIKNKDRYKIKQFFQGTSIKWDITRNNKVTVFRKDPLEAIKKIYPLTAEQFYSLVLIDGRTKSIFQSGTSKQRFDFFESIFRLDQYDKMSIPINKEFNKLKLEIQELNILDKELIHKEKELPITEDEYEHLSEKRKTVLHRFDTIRKKVDSLVEEIHSVRSFITIGEGIDLKSPLSQLKDSLRELYDKEDAVKQLHYKCIKYHEKKKNYIEITKKRNEVQNRLKELPKYGSTSKISSIEETIHEYKQDAYELQKAIDLWYKNSDRRKELQSLISKIHLTEMDISISEMSIKELQKRRLELNVEIKNLEDSLDNIINISIQHKGHKYLKCPTCMTELTSNKMLGMIDAMESALTVKYNRRDRYSKVISYHEYENELYELTGRVSIKHLEDRQVVYETKIDLSKTLLRNLIEKERLIDTLKSLENFEFKEDKTMLLPSVYESRLEKLNDDINYLEDTISKRHRLTKLSFNYTSIEGAIDVKKEAESKLSRLRPVLDKTQDLVNSITTKVTIFQTLNEDINRLSNKIDDLKETTKDFKIISSLRKAYGPQGLRKIQSKYFARKLQQSLNKFAHLIYPESMKFQLLMTANKFDILVERNGKVADIRSLSGSESSAFTLLLVISLLPFIRASDRSSIIILDEIESGMDSISKTFFIEKYLPVLMKLVPYVIIVTPQSDKEFYIPNAIKYTVTKKNGVSSIVRSTI
jgi:DNA repair exonuclease SbcCD ATPase subunit